MSEASVRERMSRPVESAKQSGIHILLLAVTAVTTTGPAPRTGGSTPSPTQAGGSPVSRMLRPCSASSAFTRWGTTSWPGGAEWDELLVCMRDLRRSDVNILTLGQYLLPSDGTCRWPATTPRRVRRAARSGRRRWVAEYGRVEGYGGGEKTTKSDQGSLGMMLFF